MLKMLELRPTNMTTLHISKLSVQVALLLLSLILCASAYGA